MTDLGPMAECRFGRKGAHELVVITPEDSGGYITLACCACGAVRRVPASGEITKPLDDYTPSEIAAIVTFGPGITKHEVCD